jgi:hypothetical protein
MMELTGEDGRRFREQIEYRQREGEPNWDANIGTTSTPFLKAFAIAMDKVKAFYDVQWETINHSPPPFDAARFP